MAPINKLLIGTLVALAGFMSPAFAQAPDCSGDSGLIPQAGCAGNITQRPLKCVDGSGKLITCPDTDNPVRGNFVGSTTLLVQDLLEIILLVISGLVIIGFILSGIRYITANGNMDAMKKARTGLINGSLAIIILGTAYLLVRFANSLPRGLFN